jgi:hypothetical protein
MTEIDPYEQAAQLLQAASEHHANGDMESAAVLTQLGQAYATLAGANLPKAAQGHWEQVIRADRAEQRLALLERELREYLEELRLGHKGSTSLIVLRGLVQR